MNILIVDDFELMRSGITRIVAEEFPFAFIIEAKNGAEAEKIIRSTDLNLVIMDLSMPDKSGLEVLKQLRAENNKTPVLILSIHPESQYAIRVLKSGGDGYISKDCPRAEFVGAIYSLLRGKKHISPDIAYKIASRFDEYLKKEEHELISDRELQVLKMIASGKTVSEIAKELNLSPPTISTYRMRLLEKLSLKNSAELTVYAITHKLV